MQEFELLSPGGSCSPLTVRQETGIGLGTRQRHLGSYQ